MGSLPKGVKPAKPKPLTAEQALVLMDYASVGSKISIVRGVRVMFARDLAELYGIETKVIMQAVQRNLDRFPSDFMFELTNQEFTNLKSQFVTSSWGGVRRLPYAFSEQGVAMLSSVLRSPRAVSVNIEIMRAFVHMRNLIDGNQELRRKVADMEAEYDEQFAVVFKAIRELMDARAEDSPPPKKNKRKIGFT
jgi:ORF6N domain